MRLLRFLRKTLLSKWALLIGLAIVGYEVWTVVRPEPWEPDELQAEAADNVCRTAAEAMPEGLSGLHKLAVVRLGGRDADGYVTGKLAESIQGRGRYDVLRETFMGNVKKKLGIEEKPVTTVEKAVEVGKALDVSGVVFGEVSEFERDETSAKIRLDMKVVNVHEGKIAYAGSFAREEPPPGDASQQLGNTISASPAVKRVLVWLAFAALLPLLLVPIIKHFLEKESNGVNLALLVALTLADLAMAYVLCGMAVTGWIPGGLLVVAVAASGVYNYWLCSTVEKLRA